MINNLAFAHETTWLNDYILVHRQLKNHLPTHAEKGENFDVSSV